MSASGPGHTNKLKTEGETPAPTPKAQPVHDIIPPWLLVGIFAVVMALTYWILADNWAHDWLRFRSLKAQRDGDYKKAVELVTKLANVKGTEGLPKSPTYESELGYSYFRLNDFKKSLEHFQRAQQFRANLPPDDAGNPRPPADFNNMIGLVNFKLGNLADAEKALIEALKVNKLDPVANFTMGELAMKKGEYTKAADYFKTVAKNPQYEKQVRDYYAEIEKKLFAGIS